MFFIRISNHVLTGPGKKVTSKLSTAVFYSVIVAIEI